MRLSFLIRRFFELALAGPWLCLCLWGGSLFGLAAGVAEGQTKAGTLITNQASAEFEWLGVPYRVNSNLVMNRVDPVYGILITPNGDTNSPALTGYALPGTQMVFSYILQNTGNAVDSYTLTLPFLPEASAFEPFDRRIYRDLNGNGTLEAGEAGNTVREILSLAPGDYVNLLVVLSIPFTAREGQDCYFDLQGTSQNDPSKTDTLNVNRTVIPLDAVLQLRKSARPTEVIPGQTIDYRLQVMNVGVQPTKPIQVQVDGVLREGVLVRDSLPTLGERKLAYEPGTLVGAPGDGMRLFSTDHGQTWKQAPGLAEEPAPAAITDLGYLFLTPILPSQEAKLEFSVRVPIDTPPGLFDNRAEVAYRNQANQLLFDEATNTVRVEILNHVERVFIGPRGEPRAVGILSDNDDFQIDPGIDVETESNFQIAGNFVTFRNSVENAANGVDTLNITLEPRATGPSTAQRADRARAPRDRPEAPTEQRALNESFPSTLPPDWRVQFFRGDGVTPLRDTNGDSLPDLGPMEPGEIQDIVVAIFIPTDTPTTTNDGQGFQAVVRATSSVNSRLFNLTANIIPEVQSLAEFWDRFSKEATTDELPQPGSTIRYRSTFSHSGNFVVLNALVIDDLSPYLIDARNITNGVVLNEEGDGFINAIAEYDEALNRIIWRIERIPPGFTGSLEFDVTVREDTPPGLEITNTFTVQSKQTATARASNTTVTVAGASSVIDLRKEVNRPEVQIGDPVLYTITVHNRGPTDEVPGLELTDRLARGFRYVEGTARLNGEPVEPVLGDSRETLRWSLPALPADVTHTLTYVTVVTPDGPNGNGVNEAILDATFPGGGKARLRATAEVKFVEGVFSPYSTIIGRVFVDLDDNRRYDGGEPGLEGIRLYLDDGTYVITDRDGLYNIPGVPGQMRVIRLDETTLPEGYTLAPIDTANAGNPASRFVELRWGVLQRANFRVLPVDLSDGTGAASGDKAGAALPVGPLTLEPPEVTVGQNAGRIALRWEGEAKPETMIEARSGLIIISFPGKVDESSVQDQHFASPTLQSVRVFRDEEADQTRVQVRLRRRTSGYPTDFVTTEEGPGSLIVHLGDPSELDNDPTREVIGQTLRGGGELANPEAPRIESPFAGTAYLSRDKITVRASAHLTAQAVLYANGEAVPESQIGQRSMDVAGRRTIFEYVGVPIRPGINTIRWEAVRGGQTLSEEIQVIGADRPESVEVLVSPQPLYADAVTSPVVAFTLLDRNDVPTGEASVVTIEADRGSILTPDFRPTENGHQVQIRNGRAVIRLSPAQQPETRRLRVTLDNVAQEFEIRFAPYTRDWIIVGGVEATGQLADVRKAPSERTDDDDDRKGLHDGSVAVFAKGTLPWWDIAATLSYDSERDYERTRLFRQFQVDEFYPTYGDESELGYDAPSRDQYYVRLEKDESHVMYGDFDTDMRETELLGSSRRFNGAKADIKTTHVDFKGYAAYADQSLVRIEIPGGGVSGYYQLPDRDILLSSEEIVIETRDPDRPQEVLSTEILSRFVDYTFDYRIGRILFKRPIRAFDGDFNPLVIVVRYELEGVFQQKYWTYGGRAQAHTADRRFALGATEITEENGEGNDSLRGLDATIKITPSVTLRGEYAESATSEYGDGRAYLVQLESTRETRAYELFYRDVDEAFSNPGMRGSFGGRREAGFNVAAKLTSLYALEGEAIYRDEASSDREEYGGFLDLVRRGDAREFRLGAGYAGTREGARGDEPPTEDQGAVLRAGMGLPFGTKWRLDALHQETFADVVGQQPSRSEVGLSYQLSEKSALVGTLQRREARSGGYDTNFAAGMETTYSENLSYFNRYRVDGGGTGMAGRTNHGFDYKHAVSETLAVNFGAEIIKIAHGDASAGGERDFWAVTMAAEYAPMDDQRILSFRQEFRHDDRRDQYFNELGGTTKIHPEHTLFARNRLTWAHNHEEDADDWIIDFLTGWAYRPLADDLLHVISDFEIRYEDSGTGTNFSRLQEFTLSTEANWQPWDYWTFGGKYAARYTLAPYADGGFYTDLKAVWARHDLTKRLYVMGGFRWLQQYNVETHQYSYGVEAGYNLTKNLQVGLGYNFDGFDDRGFSRGDFWERGPYIRLRLKFDESVLGWLNWMERNHTSDSADAL